MAMWPIIVRGLMAACFRAATSSAGRAGVGAATAGVQPARRGRIQFAGLINNRPLVGVGQQEIRNAFAKVGLREAHNRHFISRLIERGPRFGINTLNDFARALNGGVGYAGRSAGTVEIVIPSQRAAIVINQAGELVTFLPL